MTGRKARNMGALKTDIFGDGDVPELRPRRGFGWLLFRAPGALILWWRYYFAKRGTISRSARQKGNIAMEIGYSLAFWLAIGLFLFFSFLSS